MSATELHHGPNTNRNNDCISGKNSFSLNNPASQDDGLCRLLRLMYFYAQKLQLSETEYN